MIQSIKIKGMNSRCRKCGKCCEFIYFKVLTKEELDIESVNKITRFICHNPFKEEDRRQDFIKWVKFHSLIKTTSHPIFPYFFFIEPKGQKIVKIIKMKQDKCWLIKINCVCDNLVNNKCSIYPKHPIICQEEAGFPSVSSCLVRKRNENQRFRKVFRGVKK